MGCELICINGHHFLTYRFHFRFLCINDRSLENLCFQIQGDLFQDLWCLVCLHSLYDYWYITKMAMSRIAIKDIYGYMS